MKVTRFTEPQILAILRQAEGGVPVPELCREHGMSNAPVLFISLEIVDGERCSVRAICRIEILAAKLIEISSLSAKLGWR